MSEATRDAIADAVRAHVADVYGPDYVLQDWVLLTNSIDLKGDGSSTRYLNWCGSSMPHHAVVGMVEHARDRLREDNF